MPIVFVHGVAVRDPDDPQYAAAQRLTLSLIHISEPTRPY